MKRLLVPLVLGCVVTTPGWALTWTTFDANGHKYAVSAEVATWADAETAAISELGGGEGWHLATFGEQDEDDALVSHLTNNASYWIGLTDSETYGGSESGTVGTDRTWSGWVWRERSGFNPVNSVSLTAGSYTNWNGAEPNNRPGYDPVYADFGVLNIAAGANSWYDYPGDGPYRALAEGPSAVPEPASCALLAVALGGVAAGLKRRRAQKA